ncbi:MAG: sensor histidine kinase [Bacillus sp. (in: firmicutes)]
MSIRKIDSSEIDMILNKMVAIVDTSKDEIYKIAEQGRLDFVTLSEKLEVIKRDVLHMIDEGDKLEVRSKFARKRLSEMSSNFILFTEEQVRKAYHDAEALQTKLRNIREQEKRLRNRRDELERRLCGLQQTIERAEYVVTQITVVLSYLTGDLAQVGEMLNDAKRHQEFGFKIIEAQEEEKKRLSREIHDGPAQMMANVMVRADLIERIFRERGAEEALNEIRDLRNNVRSALYEVRRIIYDLRPMALDDLGLVPTLRKYLSNVEEYNKEVVIEFKTLRQELRIPSKLEVALFRLIQESVQNAIKHANGTVIQVKIDTFEENVIATIKDNGKGFDTNIQEENSFGLLGMKERVELLEGKLTIDSSIGNGTLIMISLPIPADVVLV